MSWSPDGRMLASGGNDNVLNVWEAAGGQCFFPAGTPKFSFTEHQVRRQLGSIPVSFDKFHCNNDCLTTYNKMKEPEHLLSVSLLGGSEGGGLVPLAVGRARLGRRHRRQVHQDLELQ